ncbi:LysR family transcriptional regulator [Mycobacterium antarcticum]|uniref:LysR family transcriptional regulator n=1 Tax=unclassified Mycolicibacterium TaxID=2636767 RepID=UPI002392930A|nr:MULTISPECIES: LysR substrate-binding domain-containing protein [unclassified Mycolicibacterium]GLP74709.1 LysR family transcriptional regulator [Mycolicibacterium sp. TUM20983]GLP80505.1 LysR family transcriptional regulator [Mycolicibacterium sp. TUM20984]
MDVTVRKLRYFAVVAEERHFTRAAARLFMAQQSLSRQIRDLEGEVGALLFYRTTRSVELTPAGAAFLVGVQSALASLDAAIEEARRHDVGAVGHLRIGFGLGAALELTPFIVEEFSRQFPNVEIEMREFGLPDQSAGLSNHWADVAIIRPPLADSSIVAHTLFVEPRVLTVSVRHPLAQRTTLSVNDILDVPLAVGRSGDEEYRRFWSLQDFRTGMTDPLLTPTTSNTEEIELIAAGLACTVNPAAIMRYIPHTGVRYIPIVDVPGSAVAIAWRRDRVSPLAVAFNRVAQEVRSREVETVEGIENPFKGVQFTLSAPCPRTSPPRTRPV